MIEELAEQESLKKTKIQSLVDTKIHYKKQWKMSLHNAITHFKALEVNGGMSFLYLTELISYLTLSQTREWEEK